MQISSRFTVGLHILTAIDHFHQEYKVTSDFLAGSIGTNPVLIRRLLGQLKDAGLITVPRGTGGCELAKPLHEITFWDVYQAVDAIEDDSLFRMHDHPNPKCPVGRNIGALLSDKLKEIQAAMEEKMKQYTVADLHEGLYELLKQQAAI